MDRLGKFFTLCLFTAALSIPAGMAARAAVPQDETPSPHQAKEDAKKAKKAAKAEKKLRVYDAKHNIYHDWDAREEADYRAYLEQQHEQYRAFQQLNADRQAAYWEWRASHPDVPAPAPPPASAPAPY